VTLPPGARSRRSGPLRLLGWLALLAGALVLVVWRQSSGVELQERIAVLQEEAAVLDAERIDLIREMERLRSRERIVRIGTERLDLRLPRDDEVVILAVPASAGGAR
jgi:cell division protein FtsL